LTLHDILNENGNIIIITALSLSLLLGVLSFVLNTGNLYGNKNQYKNAVEAAAMAGVVSLCGNNNPVTVAMHIATENGLSEDQIEIQTGFYDEENEYGNFGEYKNFVESINMPVREYENAVMVRVSIDKDLLVPGFIRKDKVMVSAAAVAYLKRYDMVSLNSDVGICLGENSRWENGNIMSNGDIKFPGHPFEPPDFNNVNLITHGNVIACTSFFHYWLQAYLVDWNSGIPISFENTFPNSQEITEIILINDEYIETFREKADTVYSAGDAYDRAFFGHCLDGSYLFCLGGENRYRRTYFFDSREDLNAKVIITNNGFCGQIPPSHIAEHIENITFVANCPILVHWQIGTDNILGSEGSNQVILISSHDMIIQGSLQINGATFICGGNFLQGGTSAQKGNLRIIAQGDIRKKDMHGGISGIFNFNFGPPCPPFIPKLGWLEKVE